MALGIVGDAVAAVGGLIAGVLNYMTDMFLSAPLKATLNHLEDTELKTLTGEIKTFKAKCLWEKAGAVIMAVRRPG
uniref:Uncharacterized protein n=2 Tax=Oryzias latipes TaxID=8090 RepID=A0A3B3HEJ8_ORYLA